MEGLVELVSFLAGRARGTGKAMERLRAAFEAAVKKHRAHDLEGAITGYRAILREAPHLGFVTDNLCQALLALGEYEEGFSLYDVRFSRTRNAVSRPTLPFPEWKGEPLSGRSIILFPEQGFGDQIMFARFARTLQNLGARVTLVAAGPLVRTFKQLEVDVLPVGVPFERHDFWCMIGSVPGRLRLSLGDLSGAPYLKGGPGGQGIGVAWRGRPTHHNDVNRSLSAQLANRLLCLPNALDLDPEQTGASDFEDTAEIIRSLRLVISVDTSVAHLSGAMGANTLCLLPRVGTDWRWKVEGSRTPWYDSLELVRQDPQGWETTLDQVVERSLALGQPDQHEHDRSVAPNTGSPGSTAAAASWGRGRS